MEKQKNKEYESPRVELVRQDESNKVFFTASGAPSVGGSLGKMTSTGGTW